MAGLFLVDQDGKLTALMHRPYDSEDRLQGLLEDYPDLLGGDQIGAVPRQWLFVAREAPVPDTEGGTGRWSVDHLFLDQDAIPTFVEVKQATDTRIRREVVGQMLSPGPVLMNGSQMPSERRWMWMATGKRCARISPGVASD